MKADAGLGIDYIGAERNSVSSMTDWAVHVHDDHVPLRVSRKVSCRETGSSCLISTGDCLSTLDSRPLCLYACTSMLDRAPPCLDRSSQLSDASMRATRKTNVVGRV